MMLAKKRQERKKSVAAGLLIMLFVFFHKLINPTGRIDQFLLAGKKWMTVRTNFDLHLRVDRTECYGIATGTGGGNVMILWVDLFFHR